MPIYEYRCLECGETFSLLFLQSKDATRQAPCSHCTSEQTQRLFSSFSIGGKAHPGPGRAAWPTSWNDTNGGDPETLNYWRRRIEREGGLEEKYPELRKPGLLKGQSDTATHIEHSHSHEGHYHSHPHPHPHGVGGTEHPL
jgi:putative FmdB family regulatory protein